ncbi:MAG TPA: TlpA disulfide reductase family protein [Gammaproteobacteria bacterium]|nr:TlpA disulfide reductase family protein [Gammaproteobacteria bacterium]
MALGPVVISLPRLFLLLSVVAVFIAAHGWERRIGRSLEKPLWLSLLAGLVAARLGYALTHLSDFQAEPWQVLFFWQDGYMPAAGIVAALLLAAWFAFRGGYSPRPIFVPLLVGLVVWGGSSWVQHALRQATNKPLPALAVADLQDTAVILDSFQGRPVVLNLWASWCPPCRREMPTLLAAQQAEPDVHFLFVNQGEGPVTIRQYLAAEQLQLRNVLLDLGGSVGRHFSSPGLPTTLFFDANGRLVDTHVGELSRARLGDYLRAISKQEQLSQ